MQLQVRQRMGNHERRIRHRPHYLVCNQIYLLIQDDIPLGEEDYKARI